MAKKRFIECIIFFNLNFILIAIFVFLKVVDKFVEVDFSGKVLIGSALI